MHNARYFVCVLVNVILNERILGTADNVYVGVAIVVIIERVYEGAHDMSTTDLKG